MVRFAVWRRRPDDPQRPWGWLTRWSKVPRPANRAFTSKVIAWSLGILVAVALTKFALGKTIDAETLLIVPILLYSGIVGWRRPTAEAHAALPTLAEGVDSLPVTLRIFDAQGKITGDEIGWVDFADGWLVYEGLRTAFSLTCDVIIHPEYRRTGVLLRLRDGRRVEFMILFDGGRTLLPARGDEDSRLTDGVRVWLRETHATGVAILPPRLDHPEQRVQALAFPPVYAFGAAFVAMIAHFLGGLAFSLPLFVAAFGCLIWGIVGLIRFGRELPELIE